ncbi:hypothetical protein B0H11DRAFT_1745106 [Mycena galericulata]|nr:hypothetical protein B0H11DRAFT_1745106 [Mycena galericulata]
MQSPNYPRHPLLILDSHGRVIAAFAGTPDDKDWPEVVAKATAAMKKAREEGLRTEAFVRGDALHRRGKYFTLTGGVSFGGGQKRPGNLRMPNRQRRLFIKLLRNKYIRRICGFQSSAFRAFGPKMFKEYATSLQALFEHDGALQHNFTNSIFPAVTFNLGPESVTVEHLDFHNNPMGWCAVTSGGKFNHKKGAHLHIKQLKIVVEFPSAATALFPSAICDHGNTALAAGDTRYSITQYAAGGLFRWVRYGFKTARALLAQRGGRMLKAQLDGAPGERARWGLGLFSKADELEADHALSFSN